MVYDSDFYTTRRTYRPTYSSYTTSYVPSRQVRVLPGLGKVHVVHTYDRIVPYVGHKRLTVVTSPPKVYSTRPSVLQKEYDWIENRIRPWVGYSAVNRYLNSDSSVIFNDETRLIRAQTASLLRRIHDPVPRVQRLSWPLATTTRYYDDVLPARFSSDNYVHRMLVTSPINSKIQYTTYTSEPVRKYIGDRGYSRRGYIHLYEDPLKSDIQLLSYYINKFRQEKSITPAVESSKVPLSASRPSRKFAAQKQVDESTAKEIKELREARAARLAFIHEEQKRERVVSTEVDDAVSAKKRNEEARLAEEKALAEEQARKEAQEKKEDAARKAELSRQEALAAQAAAERAAELERQAELTRQKELEKQAEIERRKREEEERARQEEQKRLEEEAKAEEERQQLLRLEELARQAEEEKEAELARQAEELAELARQEAELAEEAKKQAEEEELARQEAEREELARQEAELAELERQEKELAEQAERAKEEAEAARKEAELAEIAQQAAELAELERQQAELDALEAEAKALEADIPQTEEPQEEEESEENIRRQKELDEIAQQEAELAELERAQAELDALEAEAMALGADLGPTEESAVEDEEEPKAIAEDVPGVQSDEEEEYED